MYFTLPLLSWLALAMNEHIIASSAARSLASLASTQLAPRIPCPFPMLSRPVAPPLSPAPKTYNRISRRNQKITRSFQEATEELSRSIERMLLECLKRCHGGALHSGPMDVPEEPPQDTPEGTRETRFDAPGDVTEGPRRSPQRATRSTQKRPCLGTLRSAKMYGFP